MVGVAYFSLNLRVSLLYAVGVKNILEPSTILSPSSTFYQVPWPSMNLFPECSPTFHCIPGCSGGFYGLLWVSASFQGSCRLTENRKNTGKNMLGWSERSLSTELQDLRDV
jgi:hypothetical protein